MTGSLDILAYAGNEDVRLLAEAAEGFAKRRLKVEAMRRPDRGVDRELWAEFASMGWFSIAVPEADGGFGMGPDALAAVMPPLGARLVREPVAASAIPVARLLSRSPRGALRDKLLGALMAGELVPCVVWGAEGEALSFASVASRDGIRITGTASYLIPGEPADGYLLPVLGDGESALFWLAADQVGIASRQETRADGGSVLHLEIDAEISPAALLSAGGDVAGMLEDARDWALLATSAELLGLVRETLDRTKDYLKTRKQFGKTIGSFQALQHRMADLYLQQELAASVLDHVLAEIAARPVPSVLARGASRAKARAATAAQRVTREAIQLHGGIGFTDEHEIGLFLKRALVLTAWLGNANVQARRFGEQVRNG
ncbi:alkylation response protein AidB-like acyl-CoA dehydrogenase [Azorhizobium sp. AG788]|uniref:acyl-CoA dehydrogenase family protein n=1 Tax=Azorhizobium sp. AG788 TaxID=2183897 RepID=UPI0010D11B7A|nr:acyl-CoA dehydrogenase family protein [Azorhizobium sp. AG788]TDU00856.1 alkylation response protein AidB-like acyl-CoA dehydrogenase [Azorhizobium sp. AG788]